MKKANFTFYMMKSHQANEQNLKEKVSKILVIDQENLRNWFWKHELHWKQYVN